MFTHTGGSKKVESDQTESSTTINAGVCCRCTLWFGEMLSWRKEGEKVEYLWDVGK